VHSLTKKKLQNIYRKDWLIQVLSVYLQTKWVIITSMSKVPTKAVINTAEWPKCVYCKESIPVGLQLKRICLKCLGNKNK